MRRRESGLTVRFRSLHGIGLMCARRCYCGKSWGSLVCAPGDQGNSLTWPEIVLVSRRQVVQRIFRRHVRQRSLGLVIFVEVVRVEMLLVDDVLVENAELFL